jgi:hypothetical protein
MGGRGNHEAFTCARGKVFGGEQGGCGSGCHGIGKRRNEGLAKIRGTRTTRRCCRLIASNRRGRREGGGDGNRETGRSARLSYRRRDVFARARRFHDFPFQSCRLTEVQKIGWKSELPLGLLHKAAPLFRHVPGMFDRLSSDKLAVSLSLLASRVARLHVFRRCPSEPGEQSQHCSSCP